MLPLWSDLDNFMMLLRGQLLGTAPLHMVIDKLREVKLANDI